MRSWPLEKAKAFPGLNGMDLAKEVTTAEAYRWTQASWTLKDGLPEAKSEDDLPFHVVAYDFGAKTQTFCVCWWTAAAA
ncbi:carbamoyl phosphate synthase small subunit [Salmonella enterica subsp. arizonae]|uniref:Carbamoyl phosphate synthase small subunit n=1 Tax=Salmonella enterica subsp. arizonae TaxID=59203 RepID=A0A379TGE1_SALER|nr:carbamoyl phosphate synthase small subunit [Salmonella enterica subsp. arizonae]